MRRGSGLADAPETAHLFIWNGPCTPPASSRRSSWGSTGGAATEPPRCRPREPVNNTRGRALAREAAAVAHDPEARRKRNPRPQGVAHEPPKRHLPTRSTGDRSGAREARGHGKSGPGAREIRLGGHGKSSEIRCPPRISKAPGAGTRVRKRNPDHSLRNHGFGTGLACEGLCRFMSSRFRKTRTHSWQTQPFIVQPSHGTVS